MSKLITAIIQARTGSTRLPSKVMKDLCGRSMIEFMVERVKRCKNIDEIIIATTDNINDNKLVHLAKKMDVKVTRGSENDVLDRFFESSKHTSSEILIRLTGDCPLIDPKLISKAIDIFVSEKVDYLCNFMPPSYPDGLDIEVFTKEALLEAHKGCKSKIQREHVTPWIRTSNKFKLFNLENKKDFSHMRWTVDQFEDLEVIRNIVEYFDGRSDFSWEDVLSLAESKPFLFNANKYISRNEGEFMNNGQKLWVRAKNLIPGGNMLLSKRAEMFLPGKWPAYFSKAKGCNVWDLDNKKYIDMSLMSVGTNILGYGHRKVDQAVLNTISLGNMSTLNCPEEVLLAERLVELHPWAGMVRFARTGGEANAIAIRIARAATGRDTVAICGYHGWHDWYLATNLNDKNKLREHLLAGLEPNGVPLGLSGTVKPFSFNNINQLELIIKENSLAAIKMEVQRSEPPDPGFLEKIRQLCNKNKIILIFDECTSGFRESFGGIHKKYSVEPDMAIFGKALGNGYAITSIIGKRSIMESAQTTFISSTFWTERIGPSAALKTLEVMEQLKSWEIITKQGIYLQNGWKAIADRNNIELKLNSFPSLASFNIQSKNMQKYKTLITQEMLKKGYLATNTCYLSIYHQNQIIDDYLTCLEDVFILIAKCELKEIEIDDLLESSICHSGFNRLN